MRGVLLAVLTAVFLIAPAQAADPIVGTASVIDGDTIEIHGRRIRLHGIDAPESSQTCIRKADATKTLCGKEAANLLSERIGGRPVTCEQKDKDRYGRIVAVCRSSDGMDLNAWMVSRGQAMAYREYSTDYVVFENAAKAGSLGIWGTVFTAPWDWRKQKREASAPPAAAPISPPPVAAAPYYHSGPNCKKGKPCGRSCIALDKVCHK